MRKVQMSYSYNSAHALPIYWGQVSSRWSKSSSAIHLVYWNLHVFASNTGPNLNIGRWGSPIIKKNYHTLQEWRWNFKKHMQWNIGKHENRTKTRLYLISAEVTVDIKSKFQFCRFLVLTKSLSFSADFLILSWICHPGMVFLLS